MKHNGWITATAVLTALLLGGCGSTAQGKETSKDDLAKQLNTTVSERTLDDTQSIRSLDLEISAAQVVVQAGDDWKLETNFKKKYLTSTVKDGVLTLEQPSHEEDVRDLLRSNKQTPTITLTVPKDRTLKKLKVDLGAGTMELRDLSAKNSVLDVSAGSVTLDQLNTHTTDVSCDLGEVSGTMSLTGDGSMDVSMGSIDLELLKSSELEEINADTSMGDVTLNGKDFSGSKRMGKSGGTLDLSCDMGSIALKTAK